MNKDRGKMTKVFRLPSLSVVTLLGLLSGCGNDGVPVPGRDCSADGIGCSPGFSCVLQDNGTHTCIADEPEADATVTMPDATVTMPDAATPTPDAMVVTPDATVEPDAELPADGDGDGPDSATIALRWQTQSKPIATMMGWGMLATMNPTYKTFL